MKNVMRASRSRRRESRMLTLWSVVGRDKTTKEDRSIGYLVTRNDRIPALVAFVPGETSESLAMAASIRRNIRRAPLGVDLRGRDSGTFPPYLLGMLLLPVDGQGSAIASDKCWPGGMYIGDHKECRLIGFRTFTEEGLDDLRNEKRCTPIELIALKPASEKSKVRKSMAAR